jgi:hypothetical protein
MDGERLGIRSITPATGTWQLDEQVPKKVENFLGGRFSWLPDLGDREEREKIEKK